LFEAPQEVETHQPTCQASVLHPQCHLNAVCLHYCLKAKKGLRFVQVLLSRMPTTTVPTAQIRLAGKSHAVGVYA